MAICDRNGLPLAVHVASASPYEGHLVAATLDARFLRELPPRLIGDRGYDSDRLDAQLRTQYGIEMIAPNRRRRRVTQDVAMLVDLLDQVGEEGLYIHPLGRVINASCDAAEFRRLLQQIGLMPLIGQGQGGGHAGDTAADHHGDLVDRQLVFAEGFERAGARHRRAGGQPVGRPLSVGPGRVRAGPFATQEAAEKARARIKIIGVDGPVAPR